MRHDATLAAREPDGASAADHWALLAERGHAFAIKALQGPESPEALHYLRDWYYELARARGAGMNGPNPITYEMIESWSRLTDQYPEPHEVDALFDIDAALRTAAAEKKEVPSST